MKPRLPRRGGAVSGPLVHRNAHGQLWRTRVTPARPLVAVATPASCRFYPIRGPPILSDQWRGNMLIKGRGGRRTMLVVLTNQKAGKGCPGVSPQRFPVRPCRCLRVGRGNALRSPGGEIRAAEDGDWGWRPRGGRSGASRCRSVSATSCATSTGVKPRIKGASKVLCSRRCGAVGFSSLPAQGWSVGGASLSSLEWGSQNNCGIVDF